jgi:nuclear pore complex protein Nup133
MIHLGLIELQSYLEALAEVLLEAYSGAVTAKIERGEEHKGLLNEYWERRDALFESLYQQVKEFEATYKVIIQFCLPYPYNHGVE